jgi:hypothetical protein
VAVVTLRGPGSTPRRGDLRVMWHRNTTSMSDVLIAVQGKGKRHGRVRVRFRLSTANVTDLAGLLGLRQG